MTGYTSELLEKNLTFSQFATLCARNFGALITLRDDAFSHDIPDSIEPNAFYAENLKKAKDEWEMWDTTSDNLKEKWYEEWKEEQITYHQKAIEKANQTKKTLLEMLGKVIMWENPTEQHVGLKTFMKQQLEDTIQWDGSTKYHDDKIEAVNQTSFKQWLVDRQAKILEDIAYAKDSLEKEVERCKERTNWIQQLKQSLPKE